MVAQKLSVTEALEAVKPRELTPIGSLTRREKSLLVELLGCFLFFGGGRGMALGLANG